MKEDEKVKDASRLANLTFTLLSTCQQKESILAEQYGLTQSEFRCLKMFDKKETLNNKTIAKRMNLSASRLTRIIDGLVAKGYTEREINPYICLAKKDYLANHLSIAPSKFVIA